MSQITIKYTKGVEASTQVIDEKNYFKEKAKLEKKGYIVERL